jgi:hypothetical protein
MGPGGSDAATALGELASLLWRLRELLDDLLYRVVVQRLILDSGDTGWLAHASRELDAAVREVHTAEALRAAKVDGIAGQLGLPAGSTLARLADAAPEPWRSMLHEHREALLGLVADVESAAEDGTVPKSRGAADDIGQALEQDVVRPVALLTIARAKQSSLVDFLG